MAGQQPDKRAIQELAEDTPPIGSKGGEPPAFLPVFYVVVIVTFCSPPWLVACSPTHSRYQVFDTCWLACAGQSN